MADHAYTWPAGEGSTYCPKVDIVKLLTVANLPGKNSNNHFNLCSLTFC